MLKNFKKIQIPVLKAIAINKEFIFQKLLKESNDFFAAYVTSFFQRFFKKCKVS